MKKNNQLELDEEFFNTTEVEKILFEAGFSSYSVRKTCGSSFSQWREISPFKLERLLNLAKEFEEEKIKEDSKKFKKDLDELFNETNAPIMIRLSPEKILDSLKYIGTYAASHVAKQIAKGEEIDTLGAFKEEYISA
jgi:hypothetical protein